MFVVDAEMSAVVLFGNQALWKLLLLCVLVPSGLYTPCPRDFCGKDKFLNFQEDIIALKTSPVVLAIMYTSVIFAVLETLIGICVSKYENSMQRSLVLASQMVLSWTAFLCIPNPSSLPLFDLEFNWVTFIGMVFITGGTVSYLQLD